MNTKLENFYNQNQTEVEIAWAEHLSEGEFGSGEDTIKITDDMFWEFVEDFQDKAKESKKRYVKGLLTLVITAAIGYQCTTVNLPNGDFMVCCGDDIDVVCN